MDKLEADYKCIICQEVLTEPCSLATCKHSYCKVCITDFVKQQTAAGHDLKYFPLANHIPRCPTCTVPFSASEVNINPILQKTLATLTTACTCGKQVSLAELAAHKLECGSVKKEVSAMAQKLVKPAPKGYVNRSTFACPLCGLDNLLQKDVVKHVTEQHKHRSGVYRYIYY